MYVSYATGAINPSSCSCLGLLGMTHRQPLLLVFVTVCSNRKSHTFDFLSSRAKTRSKTACRRDDCRSWLGVRKRNEMHQLWPEAPSRRPHDQDQTFLLLSSSLRFSCSSNLLRFTIPYPSLLQVFIWFPAVFGSRESLVRSYQTIPTGDRTDANPQTCLFHHLEGTLRRVIYCLNYQHGPQTASCTT